MEVCQSGRMGQSRKLLFAHADRGFESLHLRINPDATKNACVLNAVHVYFK